MPFPFSRLRRAAPPQQKASATGPLVAMHMGNRPVWTPRDYASLARQAYQGNVVAYRCIRLVAEAAAAIPLRLMGDSGTLTDHPALALLDRPNPMQSRIDLLEAAFGYLQTAGNAYIELVVADGVPRELHVLRPDRMRVTVSSDGWPAFYEYSLAGRSVRFPVVDGLSRVLHLRSFHPLDDHYGFSPLEAAATAVDIHNAASSWNKALLDNAARPSGAVIYSGSDGMGRLSESQYRRLVEELESHHQGARNAGRPMLLEGGLDWKPMGFSPADMEFLQTKNAAARDIALAFGVPPMLLGLPGDNTYANYAEANRAFTRDTLLPLVKKLAAALSSWLSAHFAERLTLQPDLDHVATLTGERDLLWARVGGANFLTDDEKRELLGLGASRKVAA